MQYYKTDFNQSAELVFGSCTPLARFLELKQGIAHMAKHPLLLHALYSSFHFQS